MKQILIPIILSLLFLSCDSKEGLKDYYSEYFPVGAAVNTASIDSSAELLAKHFDSLTCENEMKPGVIHPKMSTWLWFTADEIADYARDNEMVMRGHTFVWHQQMPGWFFSSMGKQVGREGLLERMEEQMQTMGDRYNDVIYAWDVVNEAISDEKGEYLRESPFLEIIGEDYIAESFRMARRVMPEAKLFYNDYSCLDPVKQDKIFKLMKDLLDQGVPVDGIGFQGHWNIYYPDGETLDRAIKRFAALGLEVQITEMDISIYRHEDRDTRYSEPPEELLELQAERYGEIFQVLRDNSDVITGVTLWGVADDLTWLDNFPVRGRKNWPLIFDEELQPKQAFKSITDF